MDAASDPAADPVGDMLAVLDLVDTGARTSEDVYTGQSHWMPNRRVFGGQVLAQCVVAASRTVGADRAVHSLHGYFLRPGALEQTITFAVDRIHDGRSFSTRRVQAYQDGMPIFSMIASFQDADPGLDHQAPMPVDIPGPDEVPSLAERFAGVAEAQRILDRSAFDQRHVPAPIYLAVDGDRVAHQAVWLRAKRRLPDDPVLHRAAFAYASDHTMLEPVMRRHGIAWSTPGIKFASLDHAMWWHRAARADEWCLLVEESPSASGGRGLGLGRLYTREGLLIATVAQEGMVRVPASVSAFHPEG